MFNLFERRNRRQADHVEFCDECGCVCDARDRARSLRTAQRDRAWLNWPGL